MLLDETSGIGMTSQRTRDRLVRRLSDKGISHLEVLEAIRRTPRHVFLDEALAHRAYDDEALPIGKNQTISQPYIVALMTELVLGSTVALGGLDTVLEVGTGCGYQTAVLAQLAKRVCTIERIGSLQAGAESRLRELGFRNIEYRHGDGFVGWKERAPFSAIIVAAGATDIPQMLVDQLAVNGKLVLPVGEGEQQALRVISKTASGIVAEDVIKVKFVPLRRGVIA